MVDIRPQDLNPAVTPIDADSPIIIDQGLSGVNRTTSNEMVNAVAPVASQAESEVGADDVKRMTALKTKQSIASEVGVTVASYAAGQAGLSAVQSVNGKSGNAITLVKGDVGLGNVDNTSDVDKPVSAATQTALNLKADKSVQIIATGGVTGGGDIGGNVTVELDAMSVASLAKADSAVQSVSGKSGNSITLVKGDVGLGNVDNTSDANKPVSTAQQAALNLKANTATQVIAGAGLTGGGDLSADRTVNVGAGTGISVAADAVSLDAASIASLAKADSAIQAPGGAAGQILAKNSATTNDVGWVSSEAATAVSYGPQTLTEAQQGQAIANIGGGVLSGFRNKIINGDFDIWQRGTSQAAAISGYASDDRWRNQAPGYTRTHTQQTFPIGEPNVSGNPTFFSRTVITVSGTDISNYCNKGHPIEDVRTLAGKVVTLTFWAKSDASRNLVAELVQIFGSGGSSEVNNIGTTTFNLSTSWKKCVVVTQLPSIAGKTITDGNALVLNFWFGAGSTYSSRTNSLGHQTGTFDIAHVSLVEGDATAEADPFSPRHIQQELALCQRYFEKTAILLVTSEQGDYRNGYWKVNKRVLPTLTLIPTSGTGGTVTYSSSLPDAGLSMFYQTTPHEFATSAYVTGDAEL